MPARTKDYTFDVDSAVDDARSRLEDLGSEMRDWHDNLPESFQSSDKGERIGSSADALEDASTSIEDAPPGASLLPHFVVPLMTKSRMTRADRRDEAVSILTATIDHINAHAKVEGAITEEIKEELDDYVQTLEAARDSAEQAEFPGMYG